MKEYEREAQVRGFSCIAGVDEAGRGPLAGPVVAAAVVLKDLQVNFNASIDDSKKLSDSSRRIAYPEIFQKAEVGIGVVEADIIDRLNILQATLLAMQMALENLPAPCDYILVDGLQFPRFLKGCPIQIGIVRGDSRSLSIACASIIAKVTRDNLMIQLDQKYPQYGFAKHKGYGTKEHFHILQQQGPSPVHRLTFLRDLSYVLET